MSSRFRPPPPSAFRFGEAYRALAWTQKPGSGVPFYTRVLNRRLGRLLAAAAATRRISPNAVSLASAACWLIALILLTTVTTSVPLAIAVVAILTLSFGLDSADGQLARLTGRSGTAGEWLDHVLDAARHVAIHLAIAIALFRFADVGSATLLIPVLFAVISSTRFVAQVLAEQLRPEAAEQAPQSGAEAGPGRSSRVRALIQLPADTGVLHACLLLIPAPTVFLAVYGAVGLANAVLLAATLRRRFGELSAADRSRQEASAAAAERLAPSAHSDQGAPR